jgi:hypothetical protein
LLPEGHTRPFVHKDAGNEHQSDNDADDASEVLHCARSLHNTQQDPKATRMITMVTSNPKRLTQPCMKSGPFMVLRTFS